MSMILGILYLAVLTTSLVMQTGLRNTYLLPELYSEKIVEVSDDFAYASEILFPLFKLIYNQTYLSSLELLPKQSSIYDCEGFYRSFLATEGPEDEEWPEDYTDEEGDPDFDSFFDDLGD